MPTTKPLSYSSVRSLYIPEERAAQTLKTLLSIREQHSNDCKIVVVELGLDKEIAFDIVGRVADAILYLGDSFWVRRACDTKYKGLGEAVALLAASNYLKDKGNFYYKVSGRYHLSHNYNMAFWDRKLFNFKRYNADVSTRLYGFPAELFTCWKKALARAIPTLMIGKQIEAALPKFIPRECINYLENLGIEGQIGPDGSYIDE